MMLAGGLGVITGGFLLAVAFLLSALGYTCALLRIVACWQIWEMGFGARCVVYGVPMMRCEFRITLLNSPTVF